MKHKTVLITGGNKGIGLETTRQFLALNYEVIVVARDFEGFEFKEQVRCIKFDLSDVQGIPTLLDSIDDVDILINNAGVMYSFPYDAYPESSVESMLKLNIEAPIKLMELCAKKGLTRIVNNASVAGYTGHPDVWYGVTKAGLINATKSFSKIFEGRVIVNAVAPSPVDTDMQKVNTQARKDAFKKMVISKRFATVSEVAKTIVWLATESPEYINGTCIDINNGSFPR